MLIPPGSQLVLEQTLNDRSTSASSDPNFNDWLGVANDLKIVVATDRATVDGTITVDVQETVDEEVDWILSKGNGTAGHAISTTFAAAGSSAQAGYTTSSTNDGKPGLGFRRILVNLGFSGAGSVRVRVWAAPRGSRRLFQRLLLSERVEGTDTAYTASEANSVLATSGTLALGALAEEVSGTLPTLTVQMEESSNGKIWKDVPGAQFSASIGSAILQSSGIFSDTLPPSGFVRFRVQLGGTSPAATVRLWATGRDVHAG